MADLAMEDIKKYYPASDTLANDGAWFKAASGSIHALVGENGAGKTTLMRILYGLERADSGRILLDGKELRIQNPRDAAGFGIGMVQQHFPTVDEFSVAQNVVLGTEPRRFGFLYDRKRAEREVGATIGRYGFSLDPGRATSSLSVGERQQLEIVKLLHKDARILILDEPTAVLADQEIRALFSTLNSLKASGHCIILITHKVREVKEISDSVTVLRQGRTEGAFPTSGVSEHELSCLIMGGSSCPDFSRGPRPQASPEPILKVESLSSLAGRGGAKRLDRVDLSVWGGEVLGLCGVAGNGVEEMEEILSGFRKPSSGTIRLSGHELQRTRSRRTSAPRPGYIPADRMRRGSAPSLSLAENFIATERKAYFPKGLFDRRLAQLRSRQAIDRFGIRGSPEQPVRELSGGNIQKLILARELSDPPPSLLLCSEPTWGLDILSTEFVYERIMEVRNSGSAVLLLSSNLDEILTLSDRVCVMFRGRLVCDLENDGSLTRELLGTYMLGLAQDKTEERTKRAESHA